MRHPMPEGRLVALAGTADELFLAPAKAMEQATHMIPIIANVEASPDQVGQRCVVYTSIGKPWAAAPCLSRRGNCASFWGESFGVGPGCFGGPAHPPQHAGKRATTARQLANSLSIGGPPPFPVLLPDLFNGLATTPFERSKIPLATLPGNPGPSSHKNIRIVKN